MSDVGTGPRTVLTLDRALEVALQCSPSIALACARSDAAGARVKIAGARYLPSIDVSANLSGSKSWTDSDTSSSRFQQENVGIGQLLYDFGKTPALMRQAAEDSLAALGDLRAAEVDAVHNVHQFFFGVLKQRELVGVAQETVRQFLKTVVFMSCAHPCG